MSQNPYLSGMQVRHKKMSSQPSVPSGFHPRAGSTLLVPDAVAREREVWTHDEYRVLERAVRLLTARRVDVFFGCPEPSCQAAPMERLRRADGGLTLRCAHKDREFIKGL